jgi:hypothetical protein
MPRQPAKLKGLRIPAEWFGLIPGRPLSFWKRVRRRVKDANVRVRDFNKVRAIALAEPYPIKKELDYDKPF